MALPGVVGVGVGVEEGDPVVVVLTAHDVEEAPAELEGVPVVVRRSGELRALTDDLD